MITFFTLFLMGLQLGATACAISCLPIMTPILLANGNSNKQSILMLIQYFSGKIFAYTFISTLSYFGGSVFKTLLSPIYFSKIAGVFLILLGIYLIAQITFRTTTCSTNCHSSLKYSYFGIGFFSSFSFCLPISALIATSATATSIIDSFVYGLFFGFGVVIIPFLFFYYFIFKITNTIINELHKYKNTIVIVSSVLIIVVGILIFFELFRL